MSDWAMKKGDTLPKWRVVLKNGDGSVQNLTGATILFRMKATDGDFKFQNSATIIGDPQLGTVEYSWRPQDTAQAGSFLAEFVAVYGSDPMTFPNSTNLKVKITDNLA